MTRLSDDSAIGRTPNRLILLLPIFGALLVTIVWAWYRPGYFTNVQLLGGLLFLEVVLFFVWHFRGWFYAAVMFAFLGAAVEVPFHSAFGVGRWVVLGVGAAVGLATLKNGPLWRFNTFHLVASFCLLSAMVSAISASYPTVVLYKTGSLFLLFLYGATGARLAVAGREEKFFRGLVLGLEIMVYVTATCYLLGLNIFGNGNNLGTAMSIGAFPMLLWAFLGSRGGRHVRMLVALLTCCGLLLFSLERAGILAAAVVGFTWGLTLRRYSLLARSAGIALFALLLCAVIVPTRTRESVNSFTDAVLYKGRNDGHILESRLSPWDKAVADINNHPFFGNGFGISPQGDFSNLEKERMFGSTYQLTRENGSSYLAIMGWMGLLGLLPFIALVFLVLRNIMRACQLVRSNLYPYHFSIPVAMALLAGLIHAGFEDWLFAAGSYPAVYFWTLAFILVDLLPPSSAASAIGRESPSYRGYPPEFGPRAIAESQSAPLNH